MDRLEVGHARGKCNFKWVNQKTNTKTETETNAIDNEINERLLTDIVHDLHNEYAAVTNVGQSRERTQK